MVCYNHNPQGVSFETCATHFLCSDAPEHTVGERERDSTGTGWMDWRNIWSVGGLCRWRCCRGLRFEYGFKFRLRFNWGERAKSSCVFIGFPN